MVYLYYLFSNGLWFLCIVVYKWRINYFVLNVDSRKIKTAIGIKSYWIQQSLVTSNKFMAVWFTNMEVCNRSSEKEQGPVLHILHFQTKLGAHEQISLLGHKERYLGDKFQ